MGNSFQRKNTGWARLATVLGIGWMALAALCVSCTEKADGNGSGRSYYTGFPQTKVLRHQAVELDSVLLRYPFRIRVQDGKAAILDYHHHECFYHLFTYPEFRYLYSFGRRGQGAGETLSGDDLRWHNGRLWTLDANKKAFQVFHTAPDSVALVAEIGLAATLRPLNFVFHTDSTALVPDYSGRHRLLHVSDKGRLLRASGRIPVADTTAVASSAALAQAWRSFLSYHPGNGVLALATQLGEVLEIHHLRQAGDTPRVVQGPNGEPVYKESNGYAIPSGIMGFSDVQVGDSCIYALFQGRSFKDILKQEGAREDGGRFLYVFGLEGTPLLRYELDCALVGFYVDEPARRIIGLDVNTDRQLVEFAY